jgi:hypothetical protein
MKPEEIGWKAAGADYIVESTGAFTTVGMFLFEGFSFKKHFIFM